MWRSSTYSGSSGAIAVKKVRSRKTIAEASRRRRRMAPSNQPSGGVAERLNAAALKAVGPRKGSRGFESHPLRSTALQRLDLAREQAAETPAPALLSSPQVAHRLFIAQKTVESRLGQTYRKL